MPYEWLRRRFGRPVGTTLTQDGDDGPGKAIVVPGSTAPLKVPSLATPTRDYARAIDGATFEMGYEEGVQKPRAELALYIQTRNA